MELLKLSKFKLQIRALVSDVRDLRERERSANDQLRLLLQRQKQSDEENGKKLQELQNELALSNEIRHKLERKMSHLQEENSLLEAKQKELQSTIQNLVQSRDDFLHAYEESTCEMRRSIEAKDRKITALLEKVNSHFLLFDSIEKEAFSVKRIVDNVQHVVNEKEELASGLKYKLEKVLSLEKVFIEKIHDLESKIERGTEDSKRKDRSIAELEAKLEEAKMGNKCESHVKELQKILLTKDETIQNLVSEKKGLLSELGSLSLALHKVQDTFTSMNKEDKRKFSSVLAKQEECYLTTTENDRNTSSKSNSLGSYAKEWHEGTCKQEYSSNSHRQEYKDNSRRSTLINYEKDDMNTSRGRHPDQNADHRGVDMVHHELGNFLCADAESPPSQENKSIGNPCLDNNNVESTAAEPLSQSACSGPQIADQGQSVGSRKDTSTLVEYMDSECSTTQAQKPLEEIEVAD